MNEKKLSPDSRRKVLSKIVQGAGFLGFGGLLWSAYIEDATPAPLVLRPPGALPEKDFLKACIKCGACVSACPYDTLKLATPETDKPVGTPYFIARERPCFMCPDVPCVPVCPSGALSKSLLKNEEEKKEMDINKARMGVAVIDKESCIAYWGIQCDACYRACPLMNSAITVEMEQNERTGKHAFLRPVVHGSICTGCGACERACVIEKSAITILPLAVATGKAGKFYRKGWEQDKEKNEEPEQKEKPKEDNSKTLDYLNNWEDLVDDK